MQDVERLHRQARWIIELQRALERERSLLDAIAERFEDHELDAEEVALLDQWRERRGLPPRRGRFHH